jgi:hypothetical protein
MVESFGYSTKGQPDYEAFRTSILFNPGRMGMRFS